ncbi:hypothetical protein PJP07_31160, partial [Mycobacterium kansasii]
DRLSSGPSMLMAHSARVAKQPSSFFECGWLIFCIFDNFFTRNIDHIRMLLYIPSNQSSGSPHQDKGAH